MGREASQVTGVSSVLLKSFDMHLHQILQFGRGHTIRVGENIGVAPVIQQFEDTFKAPRRLAKITMRLQKEPQIVVRENRLPIQPDSPPQRPLGFRTSLHLIENQPVVEMCLRISPVFPQQFFAASSRDFPGAPIRVAPHLAEGL